MTRIMMSAALEAPRLRPSSNLNAIPGGPDFAAACLGLVSDKPRSESESARRRSDIMMAMSSSYEFRRAEPESHDPSRPRASVPSPSHCHGRSESLRLTGWLAVT